MLSPELHEARALMLRDLPSRRSEASEACRQSEAERSAAFEELLAGWHAAVWSPKAKARSVRQTKKGRR